MIRSACAITSCIVWAACASAQPLPVAEPVQGATSALAEPEACNTVSRASLLTRSGSSVQRSVRSTHMVAKQTRPTQSVARTPVAAGVSIQ